MGPSAVLETMLKPRSRNMTTNKTAKKATKKTAKSNVLKVKTNLKGGYGTTSGTPTIHAQE
jgi:hypothetical protein